MARQPSRTAPVAVAVLIPVLGRPGRVAPLLESLAASHDHERFDVDPIFVCSRSDVVEVEAVLGSGEVPVIVPWKPGRGDYARKMNLVFAETDHEWYFVGADDLHFHYGWLDACMVVYRRYLSCVIGTNDLGNDRTRTGQHSTHTLIHRDYIDCGTIDEPGKLFHEGYDHQYVDDEMIQTAMQRGTYGHAEDAIVEHLHPDWKKGEPDATYRKAQRATDSDRRLFESRRPLWIGRRR